MEDRVAVAEAAGAAEREEDRVAVAERVEEAVVMVEDVG